MIVLQGSNKSTRQRFSSATLWFLTVLGLAIQAFVLGPSLLWSFSNHAPRNDFISSYTAAVLATDTRLYDSGASQAFQEAHGVTADQHRMAFLRLPFYAVLLMPLQFLDYQKAYVVWQILAVCSFVAVALIWRRLLSDAAIFVVLAWSLPVGYSLLRGQDIHFFLLFYSVGTLLLTRNRSLAAGVILSLCLLKWIFLLPLPLLLLTKRLWRTATGFAIGVVAILVACTAAQGWNWPSAYLNTILRPTASPKLYSMPTVRGIAHLLSGAGVIEVAAGVLILWSLWRVVKSDVSLPVAFAMALIAGLLIGHHAFMYDAAIVAPFLALAIEHNSKLIRAMAYILAFPASWIALTFTGWALLTQALLLLLFCGWSFTAALPLRAFGHWRDRTSADQVVNTISS